jgi:hypothetical protein
MMFSPVTGAAFGPGHKIVDRGLTFPSAASWRIAALTRDLSTLLVDIRAVGEARVYPLLIERAGMAMPDKIVLCESRRGEKGADRDDRCDPGETNSCRHVRSPVWDAHKNPSPHFKSKCSEMNGDRCL